jgi:hypothetical protein
LERLDYTSKESVVSSLSAPHKQSDDSLNSENTVKRTSHEDPSLKTPELKATKLLSADNLEETGVEGDVDEDDNQYGC